MEVTLIYHLTAAALILAFLAVIALPAILGHLKDEREAKRYALERKMEYDARRAKEEDIATLLNNLVRVDTAMDYINSRGSNKENKFSEIVTMLSEKKE